MLSNKNRDRRRDLRLRARLGSRYRDEADHAGWIAGTEEVRQALDLLSDRDRELLTLIAWDGLELAEVATVLGCSARTASVRLHRARRRLSATMAAQQPEFESDATTRERRA